MMKTKQHATLDDLTWYYTDFDKKIAVYVCIVLLLVQDCRYKVFTVAINEFWREKFSITVILLNANFPGATFWC